jgi:hypothetical protein
MKEIWRAGLMGLAVLMVAGMSWGAQGDGGPLARIWAVNVGGEAMEVKVERGESRIDSLLVAPGRMVEVQRSAVEEVRIPDLPDLLLVTAPADFDPATLRVNGVAPANGRRGRTPMGEKALPGRLLKQGESAVSSIVWTGREPLIARFGLPGGRLSSAEVRVSRQDGTVLGYVTLAGSRKLEVTVDLRQLLDRNRYWGPIQQEILVRHGEVSAVLGGSEKPQEVRAFQEKSVGTGKYSTNVNFIAFGPSTLTYTVTGGPASTCGELNSYRNGSWLFGPGWLCTDASGNATKGPWTTAPGNQTDDPSFIRWPNSTTTTNDWHIWDATCPSVSYGSSAPPNSWSGTASDGLWGSCFTTSLLPYSAYWDAGTGLYWSPTTGTYSAFTSHVNGTWTSGVPGCNASWANQRPPLSAHVPGHTYRWMVCADAGFCGACTGYYQFTY